MIASGQTVDTAFFLGLLAQLEAEADGVEMGLARVDEAFTRANQGESRFCLAFLHRLRGDLLLKSKESSLAEQAYHAAIAIAKEQGARSYHLQAALPLAKLYQSTGRPTDAHAVLESALEGFSRAQEMPEIAEGQALLAALADSDEVKAEATSRPAPAPAADALRPGDDVFPRLRLRRVEDRFCSRPDARGGS